MDIYPYIIHRFIHLLLGWPKPAADSYPLALEHLESRIAIRVHSRARPLMVSLLPNPANHKRIRLGSSFIYSRALAKHLEPSITSEEET